MSVSRSELLDFETGLVLDYDIVHLVSDRGWWGRKMQVPVTDAKAKLTDLVRRAELGDEIVLNPAWPTSCPIDRNGL